MPPKYIVHASVVNIENDTPHEEDSFLVDTNVWHWMCYGRASLSLDFNLQQLSTYPPYLKKLYAAKAKLYRSCLSFAELSHSIEKVEHECYKRKNGNDLTLKEFRHNCVPERAGVISEIEAAWVEIKSLASIAEVTLNEATTDSAVNRCKNQLVDGYDLYFLESMQATGLSQILSHDGDFCTVPGITLFTANRSVILAATNQGKLLTR